MRGDSGDSGSRCCCLRFELCAAAGQGVIEAELDQLLVVFLNILQPLLLVGAHHGGALPPGAEERVSASALRAALSFDF